ncbi:MAG: hypothetical protein GX868_11235 [Actinobacteria bacterium]|nr:hypothetical protein [Actinomycetota bacterium]
MIPPEDWHEFTAASGDRWRVDLGVLGSGWSCGWGERCRGIAEEPDPTHTLGCCVLGAQLVDDDDAMNVAAHAAFLAPERFQFADEAERGGVFADEERRATRAVDGACIFLNRHDFAGGAGCALHLGALDDGEAPHDWKPLVCWQVPFQLERRSEGGVEVQILRRKRRVDFSTTGDETDAVPWLCTEDEEFYGASTPVLARLVDEFEDWLGVDVVADLARRLGEDRT